MSHTYTAKGGTTFSYNSDFSGVVRIGEIIIVAGELAEIPAQDLLEFVAECYVLPRKIEQLENAEVDELLFGGKGKR